MWKEARKPAHLAAINALAVARQCRGILDRVGSVAARSVASRTRGQVD
jgi:hypothetical protein